MTEFTPAERQIVANILTRAMDEMDDSGSIEDMFGPFRRVVVTALAVEKETIALGQASEGIVMMDKDGKEVEISLDEAIMVSPEERVEIWGRTR